MFFFLNFHPNVFKSYNIDTNEKLDEIKIFLKFDQRIIFVKFLTLCESPYINLKLFPMNSRISKLIKFPDKKRRVYKNRIKIK